MRKVRIFGISLAALIGACFSVRLIFAEVNCDEVSNIINFDYADNINIGKNRKCNSDCDWWDLACQGERLDCERIKASQILAGEPMKAAIELSRNVALYSAKPIPDEVREKIDHLFSERILDKALYSTDSGTFLTVQNIILDFISVMDGVTLGEVIVFSDDVQDELLSDSKLWLWCHELEHVVQYDQLGIDGFAQAFTFEAGMMENWADVKADLIFEDASAIYKCTLPSDVVIKDQVLNKEETYKATNTITVGPNVTLESGGNVTLHAGNKITFTEDFKSFEGGKLVAKIDSNLQARDSSGFTYNNRRQRLELNNMEMPLKGRLKYVLKSLKEPRDIKWLLEHFYRLKCTDDQNTFDRKRNDFERDVRIFNKKMTRSFGLEDNTITNNGEGTYSCAIKIRW